ncbi:MAG TPA: zinc ribbon domain-containing protein [Thermoplasmata archaeon]|nr:zinc ribbon domain-containing protein [Thermoplasmata archaeon]
MRSPTFAPVYPRTAYLLGLIGGTLIVLYAVYEIGAALAFSSRIESLLHGGTRLLEILGAVGVVAGLLVILFALRLRSSPGAARTSGVVVLVMSLLSFVAGGGLFIGLILGLIGGIMAISWHSPTPNPSTHGPSYPNPWGGSATPPVPPGVAQRFCRSCGSPNVATAQFCAKCGASMS